MRFARSLERGVRHMVLRGARALSELAPRPAVPSGASAEQRVLLLRHDRVGDMIMTTGLLRELARHCPRVTVDVLASPANASIARRLSHLPTVLEYGGDAAGLPSLARALRRRGYDAVIDAFVLRSHVNLTRALLMLGTGARARVGIGGREHDFVYTHRLSAQPAGVHHVEVLGRLAAYFGLDPARLDLRPQLELTPAERAWAAARWSRVSPAPQPRVLVNLSAGGDARRRWPDDAFRALILAIRARAPYAGILVVALPDARDSLAGLARATGAATAVPSLWEAFALVQGSTLFITPDTGLAHAASAFRTRTLVLCQSGKEAWIPWRTPGGTVVAPPGAPLADLPVRDVIAAVEAELDRGVPDGQQRDA